MDMYREEDLKVPLLWRVPPLRSLVIEISGNKEESEYKRRDTNLEPTTVLRKSGRY